MKHLHWFRWFAIAAIVVLGVGATVFSRAVDQSRLAIEQSFITDWAWSGVQGRNEAAELETRVIQLALSNDQSSIDAAVLFHQILVSRTRTWSVGKFALFFDQNPDMLALFNSIVAEVDSLGDALANLSDDDAIAKAIVHAGTLSNAVDRLSMAARSDSIAEMARVKDELQSKQFIQKLLIVFLFLVGFTLFLVTSLQNRSLARANAALAKSTRQLAESEERLLGVLETTTDGVLVVDRDYRVKFANKNAIDWMFPDRPYLGIPLWIVVGSSPDSDVYTNYRRAFEQQIPIHFESFFAPMNAWIEDHVFPTPDSVTIFFRDVTERRRQREELVRLAQHDPLTGLANRALFTERLAAGLNSGRRHRDLILLMIDLDDFKKVNDSLGHLAGDSLVRQFAQRLTGLVRPGDTVARFGGDEFAIIRPDSVEPEAGAEVARRIIDALATPFDILGSPITLAVSIGIAMAPRHGTRPDDLIRHADLALYRAKQSKGSGLNYCIFEPGLDDLKTPKAQRVLAPISAPASALSLHPRHAAPQSPGRRVHDKNGTGP